MKVEIVDQVGKKWEPLSVTLTLESAEEAVLLFHCFNHGNIRDVILRRDGYGSGYDADKSSKSFARGCSTIILDALHSRGYGV